MGPVFSMDEEASIGSGVSWQDNKKDQPGDSYPVITHDTLFMFTYVLIFAVIYIIVKT